MPKTETNETESIKPPDLDLFFDWSSFFATALDVITIIAAITVTLAVRSQGMIKMIKDSASLQQTKQRKFSRLLNNELTNCLNKLQALSNADRVLLGQFHNHEYYNSGQCRIKFSATNEALKDPSVSSVKSQIQDIPEQKIEDELYLLRKTGLVYAYVPDSQIIIADEIISMKVKCKNHLLSIGVIECFEVLLRFNEINIGIISFQYTTLLTDTSPFHKNKNNIMNVCDYIQATLAP